MKKAGSYHQPVMVDEVIRFLIIRRDGDFIDATAGGGSHSEAILSQLDDRGRLLAIDRDAEAIAATRDRLKGFDSKISVIQGEYGRLRELAAKAGFTQVSGILFDPGVSSHQLDAAERGFSYQQEGPLDLRMDREGDLTAADIVNRYPAADLANIIFEFGGEKNSRKIARAIEAARRKNEVSTTTELTRIIKAVTNPRFVNKTLARVFLSLRTVVNDEINQLHQGLQTAFSLLEAGGRLVVISYHSLEDRIVKNFFRGQASARPPAAKLLIKKPMVPEVDEIKANPRARSARMRVLERLSGGSSE